MRCPYCNSTVLLPSGGRTPTGRSSSAPNLGALVGQAIELAEVLRQLQAGNKIGAIKVYRQLHSVDLLTAKTAVEKLANEHRFGLAGAGAGSAGTVDPTKMASNAAKAGCGLAVGIVVLTAAILSFVFFTVHRQLVRQLPKVGAIPLEAPTARQDSPPAAPEAPAPPPPPSFAHETLQFGTEGIGAGGFEDARSIATDGQGHFYVGEYTNGRIQVFDAAGKFISSWSIGKNQYLSNITADRHGIVYVVASQHIYRYEGATGKPMGEVEHTQNDELIPYTDAFAALNGELYAINNECVFVDIGPDGLIKNAINLKEKVGEDLTFRRLIVLPTGEIFALGGDNAIFKFAPDGRYINRFGGGHNDRHAPGHLNSPNAIAADGKGRIYVSDSGNGIVVFDSDGNYIDSFADNETVFGITITDQNEIYGSCRNDHQAKKFVLEKK